MTSAWPGAPLSVPFGLRDLKFTRYADVGATVLDTTVIDLPIVRSLSFSETEDFNELRGDDALQSTHGSGPIVEWEIESGGISAEAWSVMSGGVVTVSGVAPNRFKRIRKNQTQIRPWFKIEGQSISDFGGDMHCVIWRCRVTDTIEGEFQDGDFFLTGASGQGLGSLMTSNLGDLYEFIQNETETAIPVLPAPTGLATSGITATQVTLNWTAVPGAVAYQVQYKRAVDSTWTTWGTEPTATTVNVTGLVTATPYNFRVRGKNASDIYGDFSNVVNATTT